MNIKKVPVEYCFSDPVHDPGEQGHKNALLVVFITLNI